MPFIVIEGLDGAGKSTQLTKLTSMLSGRGICHEYLHFPRFGTPLYGELIARFLRGELGSVESVSPYLVALLFAGDRADARPMLEGWLAEGKAVVTDRYVYSNVAYQCAKVDDPERRNELKEWILEMEFGHNGVPRPDASLFLDVPFEFTARRLSDSREGADREYLRGARDIHEESLELQRRVREVYLSLDGREAGFHVVDCSDGQGRMETPDNIFARIEALVMPLVAGR